MTGLSMVRMISHVGVRLMVRLGAKADRPHDCRIKAAACGQFGRLRTVGRSKAWRDVRYTRQPTAVPTFSARWMVMS